MADTVEMVGFEYDDGLADLLAHIGLELDFKLMLSRHLQEIFQRQHKGVILERIELLNAGNGSYGGMQQEQSTIVPLQTMSVPIDLRVVLQAGDGRHALEIQLVLKYEGIDSTPVATSDMFIKEQRLLSVDGESNS